nr:putative transcription factor [Quercus suber]
MKKSFSTGNLSSKKINDDEANTGYLSDGIVQRKAVDRERKKGTPWTEEEHVVFLAGLKKLGKGDWRGISKKFVTTRSPSQVASHAQKYFLRQAAIDKKKRRPSVFDLSLNEYEITPKDSPVSQTKKSDGERSSEATAAVQNVNRFPHVCIDIPPSAQMSPLISGAPNYSWCPSMVGMPGNEQFIPTVNFARQSFPSYSWLPGTQRNFGTCAPVITHPSVSRQGTVKKNLTDIVAEHQIILYRPFKDKLKRMEWQNILQSKLMGISSYIGFRRFERSTLIQREGLLLYAYMQWNF